MANARVEVKDKATFVGVEKGRHFLGLKLFEIHFLSIMSMFFETFENGSCMVFMIFILCFDIVIAGSLGRETKTSSAAHHLADM